MKKARDGHFWNSRPAGPGITEFHVGWINYLDADDRWRPIDCELTAREDGFAVTQAPFAFVAPRFADGAAYLESNCRFDIFRKERITAAPLGQHLTALDAAHVPGRLFDIGGTGRLDAVLYEGAFPQWNADLVYHVRHGRAPRLEKLIRFNGPIHGDIAARFRVAYTGGVEISPRRITGARRAAIWDRRGRLRHDRGFYIRALDEPQKRGVGVKTPRIWDATPEVPRTAEIEATFEADGDAFILTKHVPAAFFTPETIYPVHTDTTSYFYPDADTETTSVDGYVRTNSSDDTWTNQRDDTGTSGEASDTANVNALGVVHGTSTNYHYFTRGFVLFDTSSLPDGDAISAATLSIYGFDSQTTISGGELGIVSSSPASNTAIVPGDFYRYTHFGSTEFGTRIAAGSWITGAYNDITLNASGLANISKTGVSKFGFRTGFDLDDSAPSGSSGDTFQLRWRTAEYSGGSQEPVLAVVHGTGATTLQLGATYSLAGGTTLQASARYAVLTTPTALTKGLSYALPAGGLLTQSLRYEVTSPQLSGVIKDRQGNAIDCGTYNVRLNVYPVNNTSSAPTATQLVTAANGAWTVTGLVSMTKYLVTFEYEGIYTPLGDQDIADAAFMTASV